MRFPRALLVFLLLGLAACVPTSAPAVFSNGPLDPYATRTPAAPDQSAPALVTGTPALPTATPTIYTVKEGETFSSVALKFGVKLEDLLAANPSVNPQFLPVGTALTIPTGPQAQTTFIPSPTPVALNITQTECYRAADESLTCFALIYNDTGDTLENISAQMVLVDSTGQTVANQLALTPLNILPPNEALPLLAFFPAPIEQDVTLQVQTVSAIRLLPNDTRYLPAAAQNILVSVDWSGRSAQVTGRVSLRRDGVANQFWVAAVAYNAAGRIVGVRRAEFDQTLATGVTAPFTLNVYSSGGAIVNVGIVVEARP